MKVLVAITKLIESSAEYKKLPIPYALNVSNIEPLIVITAKGPTLFTYPNPPLLVADRALLVVNVTVLKVTAEICSLSK